MTGRPPVAQHLCDLALLRAVRDPAGNLLRIQELR